MTRSPKTKVEFIGRPLWAEVRLDFLAQNLRVVRKHLTQPAPADQQPQGAGPVRLTSGRKRMILAVVKANAYGLGAVPITRALAKAGADWFGVTCVAEGAELREAGIRQPILVLTGFWPGEEKNLIQYKLTPAITRCEQLRWLERAAARSRGHANRLGLHLKVDTGMNRLGISPADLDCFARTFEECPHLRMEGTFTHFASSDSFTSPQTEQQEKLFWGVLERLRALRLGPGVVHLANSAAIAARPSTWADMVRPGAVLYGYHQFFEPPERKPEIEAKLPVKPVLSLHAKIISLRDVAAGQGVGYSARHVTRRDSRIAVIPAGYADGLPRLLSNRGKVIVRGKFAPLVGTVAMDLTMVDVTDIEGVQVGDVVTIYGAQGDAAQHVSDVARSLDTATSSLLCALGQRVPRFYLP